METVLADGTTVPVNSTSSWPFNEKSTATDRGWENKHGRATRAYEAHLVRKEVEGRKLLGPQGAASVFPTSVPRVDPMLDYGILQAIRRKTRKGHQVALVSDYLCPVLRSYLPTKSKTQPFIHPSHPDLLSTHATKRVRFFEEIDGVRLYAAYLPTWDHLSPIFKSVIYTLEIPENRRHAFTMRLSDEVIRAALESPDGFVTFMQERIARFFKRTFPEGVPVPNFVIVLEAIPDLIPFHLHGTIEMMALDVDRFDSDAPDLKLVHEALRKAAGARDIRCPQAIARLVDSEWMYDVAGWCSYMWKSRLSTAQALTDARRKQGIAPLDRGESLMASTRHLRKDGEEWFVDNAEESSLVFYDAKQLGRPRPEVRWSPPSKVLKKRIADFIPEFDEVWRIVRGENFLDTLRRMAVDS